MSEKRKKFGIELQPSLHKRLKQRALDTDRALWEVTQEAIERYLDGVRKEHEEDKDITRARYILEHGQESYVDGFRVNIDAFYRDAVANPRSTGKGRKHRTG